MADEADHIAALFGFSVRELLALKSSLELADERKWLARYSEEYAKRVRLEGEIELLKVKNRSLESDLMSAAKL
jgi:hypothetical protein